MAHQRPCTRRVSWPSIGAYQAHCGLQTRVILTTRDELRFTIDKVEGFCEVRINLVLCSWPRDTFYKLDPRAPGEKSHVRRQNIRTPCFRIHRSDDEQNPMYTECIRFHTDMFGDAQLAALNLEQSSMAAPEYWDNEQPLDEFTISNPAKAIDIGRWLERYGNTEYEGSDFAQDAGGLGSPMLSDKVSYYRPKNFSNNLMHLHFTPEHILPFVMGIHGRLGEQSPMNTLSPDIVQYIVQSSRN